MQIFEKMSQNALNRVLTLATDGRGPEVLKPSGITQLGAFCVELWLKHVWYSILVPMSYILPSSCIRWWGVGGQRLDVCKSKQKRARINFPTIFHYPPRWGAGAGLDPFVRMLNKSLKCRPLMEKEELAPA